MRKLIERFQEWWYRPAGCTCPMPPKACARRHRVMGYDYHCIRQVKG